MKLLHYLSIAALLVVASSGNVKFGSLTLLAKRDSLIKDLLYIVKTIVYDAKYWTFSTIRDEDYEGLSIANIDITDVFYNPQAILASHTKLPQIGFATTTPAIKYTFSFKWRLEAYGAHVTSGSGIVTMTSKDIKCQRTVSTGSLSVDFEVKMESINGPFLNQNLKTWIFKMLSTKTKKELQDALSYNTKFIKEYMFKTYESVDRRINDDNLLTYVSYPMEITEPETNVIGVAFNTSVLLNDVEVMKWNPGTVLGSGSLIKDIAVFLGLDYVPFVFNITAALNSEEMFGVLDLKKLGLEGIVSDFSDAVPELTIKYARTTPVAATCKYAENGKTFEANMTAKWLKFGLSCEFKIPSAQEVFLKTTVTFKYNFSPSISDDDNKLYVSSIIEGKPVSYIATPDNPEVAVLILSIFSNYATKPLSLEAPRLRYEPLRDYTSFAAYISNGTYNSQYQDAGMEI